jgi:hypothetical protein
LTLKVQNRVRVKAKRKSIKLYKKRTKLSQPKNHFASKKKQIPTLKKYPKPSKNLKLSDQLTQIKSKES